MSNTVRKHQSICFNRDSQYRDYRSKLARICDKSLALTQPLAGFLKTSNLQLNWQAQIHPFIYLHSCEDRKVSFACVEPFFIAKQNQFMLSEELLEELEVDRPQDIITLCLVQIGERISSCYSNLAAPIIINTQSLLAKQHVFEKMPLSMLRYPLWNKNK